MPRIPLYEQQVSADGAIPSRQAEGSDFGGPGLLQIGRATQTLGQDLGYAKRQLDAIESQKAVTDVHVQLSNINTAFNARAIEAERSAKPDDTGFSDRLLFGQGGPDNPSKDSLKHTLDMHRSTITDAMALQIFDKGASNIIEHYGIRSANYQAALTGEHAKQQFNQLVNNAQANVLSDPSRYADEHSRVMNALNSPNTIFSRIGADSREPMSRAATEQISKSTVQGHILRNPHEALEDLLGGAWDGQLKGEHKIALINEARSRINANAVEANAALTIAKRTRDAEASTLAGDFTRSMAAHLEDVSKPMPSLLSKDMQRLNELDDKLYQSLLSMKHGWMGSDAPATPKTDMDVYWNLYSRIYAPYNQADKIRSSQTIIDAAVKDRKLSPTHTDNLIKHFMDAKTDSGMKLGRKVTDFLESMKPSIDTTVAGANDPLGRMKFGQYQQFVWEQVEQAKAEKGRDPDDLFREGSPHYLGGEVALKYRPTMKEVITFKTDMLKTPGGTNVPPPTAPSTRSVLPRLEGESPAAYLKRKREAK